MGKDKKAALYLGLNPSNFQTDKTVIHYPLIQVKARPYSSQECRHVFSEIPEYTHILFSSKTTVKFFFECLQFHGYSISDLGGKKCIAIGKASAKALEEAGAERPAYIAQKESSEGLVRMMSLLDLKEGYVFFPRSALSKPLLAFFLAERGIRHQICNLYDTFFQMPEYIQDLSEVDEIVFTSPSTVDAFLQLYPSLPKDKILTPIGPVTRQALNQKAGIPIIP
ncbi:MAG: uroporphyrinogen-III synthase [Simkaniaceae bacterium]